MPNPAGAQRVRRNFWIAFVDVVGWTAGTRFLAPDTVLQELLTHVTRSKLVIGLSAAAPLSFMSLTSFFAGPLVERLRRAKWYVMAIAAFERLVLFLLVPTVVWVTPRHPAAVAVLLPLFMTIFYLAMGFSIPGYTVVIAKVIPARQRGSLYGYAGTVGYGLSLLGGLLIPGILRSSAWWGGFPNGYATCIFLGALLLTISFLPFAWVVEPATEDTTPSVGFRTYLTELWATFRKDAPFRRFLGSLILYPFAAMPLMFYLAYSVQELGGGVGESGIFTILVAIGAVGGFVWGVVADRWDNRVVLRTGVALVGLAALIAAGTHSRPVLYGVVVVNAFANRGVELAGFNIVMEFAPPARLPRYYAMASVLSFLPRLVAPAVGGFLADLWGFSTLFLVAAGCALVVERLFHGMRDPRANAEAV